MNADFRGGAICLFRTHFLGWSGRFFHGCDGSFPRTRAPVPAAGSGEPLGTDAEPGPSLSDGVRGPSHPPGGCSVTRPPSCRVTRPRAWSQPSILNRFASLLAGVDAERQSQLRRLESPAFGCGPSPSSAGVSHHFYPLRRLVIRNPLEKCRGTQSNPLCMKDLWL